MTLNKTYLGENSKRFKYFKCYYFKVDKDDESKRSKRGKARLRNLAVEQ